MERMQRCKTLMLACAVVMVCASLIARQLRTHAQAVREVVRVRTYCVITRAKNEHLNLKSWIPHQLEEGADAVVVLDDFSSPPLQWPNHPKIVVHRLEEH